MSDAIAVGVMGRLRNGWTWLRRHEEFLDYTVDDYLLDRIKPLGQAVSTMEVDLEALKAGAQPLPGD